MDIWRKWRNPRLKPPFGARIDWSDTITEGLVGCWLFNESLGRPFDLGCYEITSLSTPSSYKGEFIDCGFNKYFSSEKHKKLKLLRDVTVVTAGVFDVSTDWYPILAIEGGTGETEAENALIYICYYGGILRQIHEYGAGNNENIDSGYQFSKLSAYSTIVLRRDVSRKIYVFDINSYNKTVSYINQPTNTGDGCYLTIGSRSGGTFAGAISALVTHLFIFERFLLDSEAERLYYEPYSFFLVPAARIFDLAPASGFTTTQDITWRLFTSKENQIIYNILTDKQASFGYKIFNRKDNSITYRIFTKDGSSFTWRILTSSNQDISYKIFTRLQSDLSWAIASTALSQAISYKIFTRNEVNISWFILTAEATSLDWSIFTTKEQQAIWNILAQTEIDILWDIYTRKDTTLAYKIFKDLDQDLIYKIFNSTEQDLVWKILAAGLLSEILSWKIYAKQEDSLSWKILAAEQQEFFYKIFNVKEGEITWLIKREDAADISWKLFNLKEDPILWKIYSQSEKTLAWSILAALTSQDISYKIFTVKDEELFYNILAEASKSLDWKIYTFNEQDLSWQIITDTIPEPLDLFKAKRRTLVFSPTRRIIVFKA